MDSAIPCLYDVLAKVVDNFVVELEFFRQVQEAAVLIMSLEWYTSTLRCLDHMMERRFMLISYRRVSITLDWMVMSTSILKLSLSTV